MNTTAKVTAGPRAAKEHPNGGGAPAAVYRLTATRRLVPRASERRSKMIAFGYYGGKFSHLDFILPLLPTHFTHYWLGSVEGLPEIVQRIQRVQIENPHGRIWKGDTLHEKAERAN